MIFSTSVLKTLNQDLRQSTPEDIIAWVLSLKKKVVVTTHFGPHEALMLHHISKHAPSTKIICIDHGYNTVATYEFAQSICTRLALNVQYYTPLVTRSRREAIYGGVPSIENEAAHAIFTKEVKLEPFARAFAEHQPEIWLTALRKEQTEHRASLDILSLDGNFKCLKVAPFFYWSELDVEEYLVNNDLPIVEDYYDPTKVLAKRECGLHLAHDNQA